MGHPHVDRLQNTAWRATWRAGAGMCRRLRSTHVVDKATSKCAWLVGCGGRDLEKLPLVFDLLDDALLDEGLRNGARQQVRGVLLQEGISLSLHRSTERTHGEG